MDLSAIMQNLALTRRSPTPEPEVTLQKLPNHTKPSYEQIETFPGQDILKLNFSDLLKDSSRGSSYAVAIIPAPPTHSDVPAQIPVLNTRSPEQAPNAPSAAPPGPPPATNHSTRPREHPVRTHERDFSGEFSLEDERREHELRQRQLQQSELEKLGKLREGRAPGPSVIRPPRSDAPSRPTAYVVQQQLGIFLRFFGVESTKASAMTRLVKGHNVDDDYAALMEFVPSLGSFQCSFAYMSKSLRQILDGVFINPPERNPESLNTQTPELVSDTPAPSSVSSSVSSSVPSSASTLTPGPASQRSASVAQPTPSPSETKRPTLSTWATSSKCPQPQPIANPSAVSQQIRAPASSIPNFHALANRSSTSPPRTPPDALAPLPDLSPRVFTYPMVSQLSQRTEPPNPVQSPGPRWGDSAWGTSQPGVIVPPPTTPSASPHHPVIVTPMHTGSTWGLATPPPASLRVPTSAAPAVPPAALPSPSPSVGFLPGGFGATALPTSQSSLAAVTPAPQTIVPSTASPVSPFTPARAFQPQIIKQENITPSAARAPSASPSPSTSSLFRSDPQRELIVTRGNTNLKTYMFTASSSTRVNEPPRLLPGQVPSLGDLLFNKFPSSNATWLNAQVWMYLNDEDGNPRWEDIESFYGSTDSEHVLKHPRDSTRFLSKNRRDGKPGWVTANTIKNHMNQAAREVNESFGN